MNRAATEDVRSPVWPVVSRVLHTGAAPNARDQKVVDLLDDWVRRDAPRLDADNDGKYDEGQSGDHGPTWKRIATAVMGKVLGNLLPDVDSGARAERGWRASRTSTRTCAGCWAIT